MDFDKALERHLAAVASHDLDAYAGTVHDEVSLVLPNGKLIEGRAAVVEFHREWFGDPDWSWTLTPLRQAVTGDTAVALFTVEYRDVDASGQPYAMGYLLGLTFALQDGAWLLLHDQNTLTS